MKNTERFVWISIVLIILSSLVTAATKTLGVPSGNTYEYTTQAFTTETGDQAAVGVHANYDVSYCVDLGASDQVDVDAQITPGGTWYEISTDQTADFCDTVEGPITSIRLSIQTNSSNDLTFEVNAAHRGG